MDIKTNYEKRLNRYYSNLMNTKPIEHPIYRKSLRRTAKFVLSIPLALLAMALIYTIVIGLSIMFYWVLSPLFN